MTLSLNDCSNEETNYFTHKGDLSKKRISDITFVPNVETFTLKDWVLREKGGKSIKFELASNTIIVHISEYPIGTYKKAHRHSPGAHVLQLRCIGYVHLAILSGCSCAAKTNRPRYPALAGQGFLAEPNKNNELPPL